MASTKSVKTNNTIAWQLARRYYKTGVQSPYIRFINRASRIGFAIGVAALIIGLSVMNGFERELKKTLLSVIPDIEFKAVSGSLPNWPSTAKQILGNTNVVAVAPFIELNAMVQKQNAMEAVVLKAVDPLLEPSINATSKYMVAGEWFSQQTEIDGLPPAIIGAGLAEKLGLELGERLELLLPKISDTGRLSAPEYLNFEIDGIYKIGGQMDHGQVYVPLSVVQKSQGFSAEQVQGVKVALTDPFMANRVAAEVGSEITEFVYIIDWFRSQGHVYNDIILVKDIMYLVMVLVMSVASFNIISSLSMAVQEKYGDIGILKTLGLTPQTVKNTFVLMGLFTAVRGICWGVLVGVIVALFLPELFQMLEYVFNVKVLDGDVYFIAYLPSEINFLQVLVIAGTALTIALIASLYPATKASKLTPIELLN
ncbi:lipoprotein-releasing ABC transporter permease subunit [Psychrosphaera aestuarii]|uniref:lipoprotein-releasing ABC transporter permease subunit n=1 Tax=Psychrosphaera aestuarii TaxID=1266052 RepID=UPI001B33562E|nr:lipoprotein-releasing ABC transporter permease subunit [Psychrosphaera aestuarii]